MLQRLRRRSSSAVDAPAVRFAVVDLETTGLFAGGHHRVIEIGIVSLDENASSSNLGALSSTPAGTSGLRRSTGSEDVMSKTLRRSATLLVTRRSGSRDGCSSPTMRVSTLGSLRHALGQSSQGSRVRHENHGRACVLEGDRRRCRLRSTWAPGGANGADSQGRLPAFSSPLRSSMDHAGA